MYRVEIFQMDTRPGTAITCSMMLRPPTGKRCELKFVECVDADTWISHAGAISGTTFDAGESVFTCDGTIPLEDWMKLATDVCFSKTDHVMVLEGNEQFIHYYFSTEEQARAYTHDNIKKVSQ